MQRVCGAGPPDAGGGGGMRVPCGRGVGPFGLMGKLRPGGSLLWNGIRLIGKVGSAPAACSSPGAKAQQVLRSRSGNSWVASRGMRVSEPQAEGPLVLSVQDGDLTLLHLRPSLGYGLSVPQGLQVAGGWNGAFLQPPREQAPGLAPLSPTGSFPIKKKKKIFFPFFFFLAH